MFTSSVWRTVGAIERTISRLLGIVLGILLAFVGLAMGVTGVLLPLGIVVAFAGIFITIVATTYSPGDESAGHP